MNKGDKFMLGGDEFTITGVKDLTGRKYKAHHKNKAVFDVGDVVVIGKERFLVADCIQKPGEAPNIHITPTPK